MTLLALLPLASASQWRQIPSLPSAADQARTVVVGTIVGRETEPAPFGLSTRYEILVEETLRGESSPYETLSLPGGRQGGLLQQFTGVPVWEVGDRVLVFLPPEGEPPALSGIFTLLGDLLLDPLLSRDPLGTPSHLAPPDVRPEPLPTLDSLRESLR